MRTKQEIKHAFNDRRELANHRSFVLVGIGGAGMSGVARMLVNRGLQVKGTDLNDSEIIHELQALGVEVLVGHTEEIVTEGDAVILSDAIPLEISPEVRKAKELGCPIFRRSQALGWLLEDKKVIAVTGTHGKTTTTGMIGAGLLASGLDPTIVVGAEVPEFGGAVREGKGDFAVVEACEAYDSFHDFDPYSVVLTNLELDHVDFHGDWPTLLASVKQFLDRVPEEGMIFYHASDKGSLEAVADNGKAAAVQQVEINPTLPGDHNRVNASAAMAACQFVACDLKAAQEAIEAFTGPDRRLQVIYDAEVTVVDDYAHHPTEIRASISALREKFPNKRLVVAYQPHLYSRTADLIPQFADALDGADLVFMTDIYPAREEPIPGVSSLRVIEEMSRPTVYVPSRHLLPRKVAAQVKNGDVVVGMGAGNIDVFAPALVKELNRPEKPKVAVIYGGDSAEREVSILSGKQVYKALIERGYDAQLVDVTERLLGKGDLNDLRGDERPDVAFLCVHGTHAEDGAIHGLLELLHIPYTGPNLQVSAIAMDKQLTKTVLEREGVPVPKGTLVRQGEAVPANLSAPLVVKPNAQGSTVGLTFVDHINELERAVSYGLQYDDSVLIEEMVEGIEISVPVARDVALPPVEIVPASGRYDFESKYTPGATEEICPAVSLTEDQAETAKMLALKAHRVLGCEGVTRTDMIVTGDRIVVLEINTLPGMTETSLVPRSAAVHGWSFGDLVEWMVVDASEKKAAKV